MPKVTTRLPKNSIERVREAEVMAETDAEIKAATLWRKWARWSRRFDACPDSLAYDRNEAHAWAELRAHLDRTMLDHTAFDPAD
jgi:hypothetical protein